MRLCDNITAAPIPFDPARGAAVAGFYGDLGPAFRDLVAGTAGCSGFLAGTLERERDWVLDAASGDPDAALGDCLSAIGAAGAADASAALRIAKRRIATLAALCDLGGVWPLERVTGALTALADAAVGKAIAVLVAEERARGKLPEVAASDGGLFAIAMGKMGAAELNYSSDIDLILLFDESLYPPDDYPEIRKAFVRVGQKLAKMLSDVTADGYVFRTDLRLRPDPSVTPVVIGMGAAERYYESQGRTWERAAMIKARICAGDLRAGEAFLQDIAPFIWRRHLDFATIEEAHDMRLRIRTHKGLGGPLRLPGHDVKLGRGGIREIEFFTQTRQLICGGRDPALRLRQTRPALAALADAEWVEPEVSDFLSTAYVAHRTLEHRLQMLEDAQTQTYPTSDEGRARLAAFCGAGDLAAFEAGLMERFERVHALTEGFFAPGRKPERAPAALWDAFPDPARARAIVDGWQALPALRTTRARGIFGRLAPGLSERLSGAADPNAALDQFDNFLRGLPAGIQVLSLFEANPRILDLIVDICATAPSLAAYLGRNADVLDAVLGLDFFAPLPGVEALTADLNRALDRAEGYEAVLDAARVWRREQGFRIGVQLLRAISTPREAGQAYSDVAEAVLTALLPRVVAELARRFGPPPGNGLAVIGMGKLGSREMTASSDLDLIIVYDAERDAVSEGPRPLPMTQYFSRLTQALVSALTAPTAHGTVYKVDMRLRPSGRQGPVATSLSGFASYQRDEAWTWEHLALTRARVVASVGTVAGPLRAAIAEALSRPKDPAKVRADVRDMRRRLAEANQKAAEDPWEVKLGPGRMLDIEMALQTGRVLHPEVTAYSPVAMIPGLVEAGYLDGDEAGVLRRALDRLSAIQQIGRVALDEGYAPERAGPGLAALLAQATGVEDIAAVQAALAQDAAAAAGVVTRLLEDPA